MIESDDMEKQSNNLLEDYNPNEDLEDNELEIEEEEEEKEENNDKSCICKCCFYLFCCCCCHSTSKGKGFYKKGWRTYLVKEGNDTSDVPFRILTKL